MCLKLSQTFSKDSIGGAKHSAKYISAMATSTFPNI